MKKFIAVSLMIFVAFLPEVLLAHPGHGGHEGGYTIIHYIVEPTALRAKALAVE